MEKRDDIRTIFLKEHIDKIARINNVLEIYLFGSRAFKTGCKSSDIDILIYHRDGMYSRNAYGDSNEGAFRH